MNSKERVYATLKRTSPDRTPVYMWFHPDTTKRLAGLLDIAPADVAEAMGNDVRQAWVNNNHAMEGIVHEHDGESHVDDWGITWTKEGSFNQITNFPLANATEAEIDAYHFPAKSQTVLLDNMLPVCRGASEYFIGVDVSPCAFEMYWRLRGMEAAMLDLVAQPDMADRLMARCADFAVSLSDAALERFPVDWLWTGDDVAGQQTMMMNPELWRERVKPHLMRVVDVGITRGLPVAYHCCGALHPIIEDLIDMGITILNPIQCNCPGMEPLALKREFGDRLTFMGGVDTQELLPRGTESEVRRATRWLLDGMMEGGGGYILAASHTVPPETPDANLFAMYEEAGITREEIFDRAAVIRARK